VRYRCNGIFAPNHTNKVLGMIITCGPTPLRDLVSERIEFVDEEKLRANGPPSLVRVTDFMRRVTYLSVDQCGTFFVRPLVFDNLVYK
jgi:hypothetical protein